MNYLPWKRPSDVLPLESSEVFAAIAWDENVLPGKIEYGIHDCHFYPLGASGIFRNRQGFEFKSDKIQFWIYKTELAASVPQNTAGVRK